LFLLIRVIAVFIGVENVPPVVHPAIPVGGAVEFHFAGEGVNILVLTADEKIILVTDCGFRRNGVKAKRIRPETK